MVGLTSLENYKIISFLPAKTKRIFPGTPAVLGIYKILIVKRDGAALIHIRNKPQMGVSSGEDQLSVQTVTR